MRLAINQPYFFPYIGYFQLIQSVDKFMLYENVAFRGKGWMTRNFILPKNSNQILINIPVVEKSSFRNIDQIMIILDENWLRKFSKTIYNTYKKTPFFGEFYPIIEKLMLQNYTTLHQFNSNSILQICRYLDIQTEISIDHSAYLGMEHEMDRFYSENHKIEIDGLLDRKTFRVIQICKRENAKTYHNSINGMQLYDRNSFSLNSVEIKFLEPKAVEYKQFNEYFVPNLSIIDVIMHCGRNKTREILNAYQLV